MKVMWVVGTLSETGISILADKIIKSFTGKQSRGCSNFTFSFSLSKEKGTRNIGTVIEFMEAILMDIMGQAKLHKYL